MSVNRESQLTVAATGDAILTRELLPYEGVSDQFDEMLRLLRTATATVTNLEVLVHDYDNYPSAHSGGTYMRAPPKILDELSAAGCNLFSTATNHSFDFGYEGVQTTVDELRKRNLTFAGLGDNLYEARKPAYLETPAGRVALLSASTSMTPGSEAGEQSPAMNGRPGLNPLSVERIYRLPNQQLETLKGISETAGIEDVKQSWRDRGMNYKRDWNQDEYFHFGDMKFEPVDDPSDGGLAYELDEDDSERIHEWVVEAKKNADWVVMCLHTHQGTDGLQNTQLTPDFVTEFARECIDAGSDVFVGTGPHVLRGLEIYRDSPIFYSLGNFVVQSETVDRLPPESYARYGHEDCTKTSRVFDSRLYDESGTPKGDLENDAFWETVIPTCTFDADGELDRVELHPCTLQQRADRPQRGIPVLATDEKAHAILDDVAELSLEFGTEITREGNVGVVKLD